MPRILALLAVGCLAFAPVPPPPSADAAQGTWQLVTSLADGEPSEMPAGGAALTIKGGRMSVKPSDAAWDIKLSAGRSALLIDAAPFMPAVESPPGPPGAAAAPTLIWGLCKVRGDVLTLCWRLGKDERSRPTSFDPLQKGVHVQVFKRAKP